MTQLIEMYYNFKHKKMENRFIIQIKEEGIQNLEIGPSRKASSNCQTKLVNSNFSGLKFLNHFRKLVIRFMFIVPPGRRSCSGDSSSPDTHQPTTPRQHVPSRRSCDWRPKQHVPSRRSCDWRSKHVPSRRSCDWRQPPPPATLQASRSYNSSLNSHYNEAIADCIEFLNKSSHGGISYNSRISDTMV
ncbi:hypothetical protein LIER_11888 [Lithospermum erythrorhizon]|uniref:Uncharacterized protein n=1 Tax=Lithospermum erythrorhizon TaxID=34254 RepID=A0AAV3PRN2_LITER